jgi:hypothetical protein
VRTIIQEAAELREHAERCRRLAGSAANEHLSRILQGFADEYSERAVRLERQRGAAPPQQPMQQQQRIQPDENGD